ncbi:mechanosensitive ion channel family protein [Rubripirellula reticaptiva]|uniref:Small-conductance mechanosensitive channel n=1 Tax=Rubripirellula reticaptiva TaxID=2528013 RepID=A0A5C6EA95_9BACT|nr:mechanosensitive ion channel family protein [Rubripirellula reticaptiva]TWU46633.1 Small-conductance mechanosensitive channel [Rubripirellula reticaptiva]
MMPHLLNRTKFQNTIRVSFAVTLLGFLTLSVVPQSLIAQDGIAEVTENVPDEEKAIETPDKVEVDPLAEDDEISLRLERIFTATGWFDSPTVKTDEGVVFLSGVSDSEKHREWAERVAQRTSDVVAVVNRIEVRGRPVWDISPAVAQMKQLGRDFVQLLPLMAVGAFVLFLAYSLAKLSASLARKLAARRVDSQLLQQVLASVVAVLVMLIGLYIALKVSGLSRLAVTVLGGTGLVGIALGFAFRDIAENYLASVLISLNRPFSVGDLIELDSYKGFVRRVTTRGTLLLTVDGNHIQIPNSTIYKSAITNYSSSPRIRKDFIVGIGFDDSVSEAQEIIHETLVNHPSVLNDPEPLVLVESLGSATVNLKVLFWLDGERFDAGSVTSSLMRQAKTALTEAQISMPDEAREVVFPNGVPVAMIDESRDFSAVKGRVAVRSQGKATIDRDASRDLETASKGEGSLKNSDDEIQRHADNSEVDDSENLID